MKKHCLTREKERLIEITVDGELTEDELPDFLKIKEELERMAAYHIQQLEEYIFDKSN